MTFCFAFSSPNMSIVAADTRVNFTTGEGHSFTQDGPEDFYVSETTRNYDLFIPFKFRKIRRAGDGWITSSGDFMLGKKILDKLSLNKSDDFYSSNAIVLQELPKLKSDIQDLTGFSESQIINTVILGAPFKTPAVWLISLNQDRAKTVPAAGNYLASWPPGMNEPAQLNAITSFEEVFIKAYQEQNIVEIIRSIARLVHIAEQHSNTVGSFTQIGLTIAATTKVSFYLEENSSKILSMSCSDLKKLLLRLTS